MNQQLGEPVHNWTPPPYPSHKPMSGRYCRLEPLDAARHADELFKANSAVSGDESWTYLPYGPFATPEEYRQWVEKMAAGQDPQFYAIIDLEKGNASGVASYLRITPAVGSIEVGHIHYSPQLQRTIAATEAMFLLMSHAFDLGYRRYEWKCDALNAASRSAAKRLGFTYEGLFRQATVVKGRNRDTAWFSAIDSEWPEIKQAFETWLVPSNFDQQGRQQLSLSSLTAPLSQHEHS